MADSKDLTNILVIIEDNKTDLDIYLRFLRAENHGFSDIRNFQHPNEALEYLHNSPPSCCLLDFHFQESVATNFIVQMKSEGFTFPIVVSTGKGDEQLAVELLHMGVQDYLVKDKLTGEVLVRTLKNAVKSFNLEKDLHRMAHYDALTNLLNRSLFMDRLEQGIYEARRYNRELILLSLDIDHFKQINDTYGHDVGDKILVTVAQRLKACLRESDSAARLGGDEFAILLPETTAAQGHLVAQKILETIPLPVSCDSSILTIFPSIGLASFPESASTHLELLKQADIALYKAKEQGRAQYVEFSTEHSKQHRRKSKLMRALPEALEKGELSVAYQPIYNFKTDECKYVEALVRWSINGEEVPGQEVVDLVLEGSLGFPFHSWLFKETLKQLKEWRNQEPQLVLSLNMPTQIFHSEAILNCLMETLLSLELLPNVVMFEVTEVNLMQQTESLFGLILKLCEKGFELAISEFGIGNSSVELLAHLPCKLIKIDRQFIQNWETSSNNEMIVKALVNLAHHLKLKVAVVGVEKESVLDALKSLDCDYGQGYWLGIPLSFDSDWNIFIEKSLRYRSTVLQ